MRDRFGKLKAFLVGIVTLVSTAAHADVLRLYECSYLGDGKTLKPLKRIPSLHSGEIVDAAYQAKENLSFAFADVTVAKDAFQLKVNEITTGLNFLTVRIPETSEKTSTLILRVNERLCFYSQISIKPQIQKIQYSKAEFLGIPSVTSCSLQTSGPNYSGMFIAFALFSLVCLLMHRLRQSSEKLRF